MAKISVHDNIITGYMVSCDKRELVIHTEFRDREPNEKTDIIFYGVEAYYLVRDNMQSILFDVAEYPIEQVLIDYSSEFESGRKYCWPGSWNESNESCQNYFTKQQCKGWKINSSYGMEGFVIAKNIEFKQQ
jgi:hypothetical protein